MAFPTKLKLNTPGPLLSLVGLGVRTVSFLRVKVYSAGFYIEEGKAGQELHHIPGWHVSLFLLALPPVPFSAKQPHGYRVQKLIPELHCPAPPRPSYQDHR